MEDALARTAADAKAKVPAITPEEAAAALPDVIFFDVRVPAEVAASG